MTHRRYESPWSKVTEEQREALRQFRAAEHAMIRQMMPVQIESWSRFWADVDREEVPNEPHSVPRSVETAAVTTQHAAPVLERWRTAIVECGEFIRDVWDGIAEMTVPMRLSPVSAITRHDLGGSSELLYEAQMTRVVEALHLDEAFDCLKIEFKIIGGEPKLRLCLEPIDRVSTVPAAVEIEFGVLDPSGKPVWTARPLILRPTEVNDTGFVETRLPTDPDRFEATLRVAARELRNEDEP
jgi:hypothetical protein